MDIPLTPFAEWLPDLPPYNNPGVLVAKNCTPAAIGYEPFPRAETYAAAPTGASLPVSGGAGFLSPSGVGVSFAGDVSKLYRLDASTQWADASRVSGYTTGDSESWRFALYSNLALATNFSDPVQVWPLSGPQTEWADLAATAPRARYMAVVKDHLVLGYTNDSADDQVNNRVWWSPIGQPDDNDWGNVNKLSDFQDLSQGNAVTGLVGGEFGLIFMDTAIYRMTFTGDASIYQFDAISVDKGCIAPGSVAKQGGVTYFLSDDGFYVTDGSSLTPIGANKVDRWFFRRLSGNDVRDVRAVIDPARKLYIVGYPAQGSQAINEALVYRYDIGRWSYIETGLQAFARLVSPGYTLEGLNDVSMSIDALPASLDDRIWRGGAIQLGGFASDGTFKSLTGPPMTATVDSAEVSPFAQARSRLRRVRPIADGAMMVSDGVRTLPTELPTWSDPVPVDARGRAAFRADARFHRIRCEISGDWTYAHGFEAEATGVGRR